MPEIKKGGSGGNEGQDTLNQTSKPTNTDAEAVSPRLTLTDQPDQTRLVGTREPSKSLVEPMGFAKFATSG